MKVIELGQWVTKHKQDKNYVHRELSDELFFDRAMTSFNRLNEEQKKQVFKVCKQYDLTDMELIVRARFMCQTNLFGLCKLLGYEDMSEKEYVWTDGTAHTLHESVCNSFFVRKDPTFNTFKKFAMQYVDKKERLLLIPRGCFKSTMDMADTVQYIICWPEVTILILTGILDLAKDFVGEIKGHFTLEKAGDEYADLFGTKKNFKARTLKDGTPSIFQMLFPEHVVPEDDGKHYEYQTPAVTQAEKECTVFAASIEQALTGWHVGVMKLDDVVTNENSQTVDRLKNVNKQVSINSAMLHPYGFLDKIGTWYDTEDTYGQDMKNYKRAMEDGEDFSIKIYIRAAWWPNEAARKLGKIEEEMSEADYDLLFGDPENPHQLSYNFLLTQKKKNAEYFAIKYLNDPTQAHVVKFPRELLMRRTINANLIPGTGMIVTTIDTAYSTKSWADYTVILTALIYGGKFYVIDMSRGKFNEYELLQMVAATALKWKPVRICIEDNHGRWIGREIYREMDKLKVRSSPEFLTLGKGDKKVNAKSIKAKPVLRYLGDERLLFSNSMPGKDELYDELEKFGTAASTHDDIVDALSILVNTFASYAELEGRISGGSSDYIADPLAKQKYDQAFGLGNYARYNAQQMLQEAPELSPQEAIKAAHEAMVSDADPFQDLFN